MATVQHRRAVVMAAAAILMAEGAISPARAGDGAGATLYQKWCVSCHGEYGKGDGRFAAKLKTPPADFATVLAGKDDAYVVKVIREGGSAVGKSSQMPAAKTLTDGEVGELVAYVKGLIAR